MAGLDGLGRPNLQLLESIHKPMMRHCQTGTLFPPVCPARFGHLYCGTCGNNMRIRGCSRRNWSWHKLQMVSHQMEKLWQTSWASKCDDFCLHDTLDKYSDDGSSLSLGSKPEKECRSVLLTTPQQTNQHNDYIVNSKNYSDSYKLHKSHASATQWNEENACKSYLPYHNTDGVWSLLLLTLTVGNSSWWSHKLGK